MVFSVARSFLRPLAKQVRLNFQELGFEWGYKQGEGDDGTACARSFYWARRTGGEEASRG